MRFLISLTPAACSRSHEVVGVRISNENDRSGRTVTLAGTGTPGVIWAVRALNSCKSWSITGLLALLMQNVGTLQKSMLLTPLLPKAGPTGGLGLAWPAPTISLTI